MSQCLLWLGLTLLGVLQTQVHGSGSDLIPLPPLDLVPVQAEFREDLVRDLEGQVQGGPGDLRGSFGKDELDSGSPGLRLQLILNLGYLTEAIPHHPFLISRSPCLYSHCPCKVGEHLQFFCTEMKLRLWEDHQSLAQGHPIPAKSGLIPCQGLPPPVPAGSSGQG
jgi:hypothetical protein